MSLKRKQALPSSIVAVLIAMTILAMMILEGCGGRKVVPTKQVELALPEDLAKAFEVKERPVLAPLITAPAASPLVPAAASKKTAHKLKRKGGRKDGAKEQQASQPEAAQAAASANQKSGLTGPSVSGFVIPNRRPPIDPLWIGEKVWMDVTWLSTKAGEFLLEVLPLKSLDGRTVYDLKGSARTSDLFSLIYKAEDWVESFVDYEGWFPYKFILHGDETKHIRNNLELFDHANKKQYVHIHDNRVQKNEIHEEKDYKELTPFSQDALSALYYARTQKLDDGAILHFPMTTSGTQWETEVTVLGREEINTKMGYVKAIKTKVATRFHGVLQQQGDAFIWFSDDARKFVLRFEAKVRIGWVAGIAKKIELGTPPGLEHQERDGKLSNPNNRTVNLGDPAGPTGQVGQQDQQAEQQKRPVGRQRRWFHQLMQAFDTPKK